MQELENEGRMFQTFLHINKIPLSEVSENTNMTSADVYELFSFYRIPDEKKFEIEEYLNRSFDSIMDDQGCKDEMIRKVNDPQYKILVTLQERNNDRQDGIEKIIKYLRNFIGE